MSLELVQKYAPQFLSYGVPVLGAILILALAWIVSGVIARVVSRVMRRANIDETLTRFTEKLIGYLVLILGVLACLSVFGVETTSFAAVLGSAGLAIGLAMQGSLSNFAAGVMLLVLRPFKVGDVVKLAGEVGIVHSIEMFNTSIDTPDHRRLILPNGAIFGSTIENITFHTTRRVEVLVGTSYAADVDETRAVLQAALADVPKVLDDPKPAVVLMGLGNSSVDWAVRVWTRTEDYWEVRDACTRAVKLALDRSRIEIPFPQMNIHLDPSITQRLRQAA